MTLSSNTYTSTFYKIFLTICAHRMLLLLLLPKSTYAFDDTVRHRGAITKAQRHAAKDGLACKEKFLRDVSLCYLRDAEVRARGMGQSKKT